MKKIWPILFLILALQLVLRLPFLQEPLNPDEATYWQIAGRMSQGELLYRDLIDVKPPGIFYIFQLIGQEPFTLRLITALYSLLATLALFLAGRRLLGDRAGLWAALLFAVFSGGVFIEGTQANPETFMALPLVLSLAGFLAGNFLLAGLLAGAAIMIKQTAAFSVLALLLVLLVRQQWRPVLAFLAGSLVLPGCLLVYYLYNGALAELFRAVFVYSAGMVKPSLVNFLVKTGLLFLLENSVLWLLAIVGVIYIIKYKLKDEKLQLLLAWSLFSLLGVYAAGYALGHYYIQLIPALCLLGGVGLARWRDLNISRIFILMIAAFALFTFVNEYEFYLKYGPDEIATQRYGTPLNAVARRIGLRLKARTTPADRVFGISSAVVYSGRSSLTKYYLTVRGGRSEIWFLGRRVFYHDFGIERDPRLVRLVDEDFYRNLSDPRTKYWAVNLKDNYSPADLKARLQRYGYELDRELSDLTDDIIVFRRK